MSRASVERRLLHVSRRMATLRDELAVADDQLAFFQEAADELRLRALVSETPIAEHEHHEARKHAEAMGRHRAEVSQELEGLERLQDELLDQLLTQTS